MFVEADRMRDVRRLTLPNPEEIAAANPILGVMYFLDVVLLRLQSRARSGQHLTSTPAECELYLKDAEPFCRILNSINARETCPAAQVLLDCIVAFWLFQLSRHQEALSTIADAIEIITEKPYAICKPKVYANRHLCHHLSTISFRVLTFHDVHVLEFCW